MKKKLVRLVLSVAVALVASAAWANTAAGSDSGGGAVETDGYKAWSG